MRGKLLGARYRIQNRIGEGGMAFVYVALDEKLGRKVAIKVLHKHMAENEDIRKRFYNEARAISTLDHRNILKIYDFSGEESRELWIVTEILKGLNLSDYVATFPSRWLHPIVAACVCREILKAMGIAHAQNIVHRDIKPENIMILDNGLVKLMDFGIAKNLEGHSMTLTGTFMGSPSYMSPEQIRGRSVDSRSDLYSLGVLFYEIVTGKLPYTGNSTHDVVIKICEGHYQQPKAHVPNLPDDVNHIIVKAISKHPSHRYQEARTFAADLDTFLSRNGFEESHIELERYFTDREKFVQRLRKLQFTNKAIAKAPSKTEQGHRAATTRTKHTQVLKPNMSNIEAVRIHNDNNTNRQLTKTNLGMIDTTRSPNPNDRAREAGVATHGNAARKTNHMTAQTAQINDTTDHTQLPGRKRRAIPRSPKRKQVRIRFAKSQFTYYHTDWFSYISGAFLVALIGALAIWGFWRVQNRVPRAEKSPRKAPTIQVMPKSARNETAAQTAPSVASAVKPKTPVAALPDAQTTPPVKTTSLKKRTAYKNQTRQQESIHSTNEIKNRNQPLNTVEKKPDLAQPNSPPTQSQVFAVEAAKAKTEMVAVEPVIKAKTREKETRLAVNQVNAKAEVLISSVPAAEIYINNRRYGTTIDQTSDSGWLTLNAGKHTLELRREGFATYQTTLTLKGGQQRRLAGIRLAQEQGGGQAKLILETEEVPCQITITSLDNGNIDNFVLRSHRKHRTLAPGKYRVHAQSGSKFFERTIEIDKSNSSITVSLDLR